MDDKTLTIQIQALMQPLTDISVDQIIQRVMIRPNHTHYNYTHKTQQQLTPPQHIWHFQLQEENIELKQKVQKLKTMLKKKEKQINKQLSMQNQINQLKEQLEAVLKVNTQLQKGINKFRLKNNHNTQINESLHDSLEESLRNRKTNRECSSNSEINTGKASQLKKIAQKDKLLTVIESPVREILKTTKEVSISCKFDDTTDAEQRRYRITAKRNQIRFLEQLVKNQQRIIQQYQKEIQSSRSKQIEKKYAQSTTQRIQPLLRPTSIKTMTSAPGSIVKMKRK